MSLAFPPTVKTGQLKPRPRVTWLRDGMNLVAKEYLASKPDATGVLILSELAGAAREMNEAMLINPHHGRWSRR